VALLAVLLTPPAHADWYIAVFAGLNEVDDTTLATGAGTLDTAYDLGPAFAIAVGYDFGNRLRLEGEFLTERENDVDVHRLGGIDLPGSVGTLENEVGIANLLVDFRREARVSPYVGLGAGVAEVTLSDYGFAGLPEVVFAEDNVLAYQAIAGVAVKLSPSWSLQFDARYYETDDPELDFRGVVSELAYSSFNLMGGFRYTF
jgi:opacity protein-like surface antigen